jgi:hypothetical protein
MKNTSKNTQKSPKNGHFFTSKKFGVVSTFLTLLFMMGTTNSLIAQKFNGVELNQNYQIVINQFIAKGWVQKEKESQYTTLNGKLLGEDVILTIYSTLTSRKVRKIVLFYTSSTSWESARSLYDIKVEAITNKYGSASDVYEQFYEPYYLGDGYELQAFDKDKVQWIRIWADMPLNPNLTIAVEIGKSALVMVTYEVMSNMDLHLKEVEKAQSDVY